jgi:hypothetical protein
MDSVDIVGNEH